MTDTTDIVERLRDESVSQREWDGMNDSAEIAELLERAIEEIEAMREVARLLDLIMRELVDAFEPIDQIADEGNDDQPDSTEVKMQAGRSTIYGLNLGMFRRIRAATYFCSTLPQPPEAD